MKILGSYLDSQNIDAKIVRGEDNQVQELPLIVVSCSGGEEAIFQSGIYSVKLSATVKVDLDSGSPNLSAQLFGAVFDVFQMTDLMKQINDLGNILIKGIVLLEHSVEDVGDRQWNKTVSSEFFGYAVA